MKHLQHIALLLLISLTAGTVTGQDVEEDRGFSFEFRGESLSDALDHITRTAEIDLVYDPQLVRGHHVYQRITNKQVPDLLTSLLREFQLDFLTLSSGTIVIIKSVSEGPYFGTFSGKITDSETGEPLPGATVYLADASGGTSTNQSGTFSLNRLMTGSHTIIFSYVGYEPVILTLNIDPNEQVRRQISLKPKPVDTAPLIVEAHRPALPSHYTQPYRSTDTSLEPGSIVRSPIRTLNFAPGVQYGLPMTDLHMQGGQQTEHRIFLDGIPIYNPYSFGRLFSAFSPYAIGRVELHKAGYGAEYGSQIAGLINLRHEVDPNGSNRALFQADPLSLNFRGDLNLPLGSNNLSLMTALRTNFWNMYQDPALSQTLESWDILDPLIANSLDHITIDATHYSPLEHQSAVSFFDYHLAATYQTGEFSTLSGSFYLAENMIETRLLNQQVISGETPPYLYSTDYNHWSNLMGRVGWNSMITPRLDLSIETGISSNRFSYANAAGYSSIPKQHVIGTESSWFSRGSVTQMTADSSPIRLPGQIDGNDIDHWLLKGEAGYSISRNYSIDGGVQADVITSRVQLSDAAKTSSDQILTRQQTTLLGSYLMNRHRFGTYWSLDWGSRFTYASHTNRVFAEPRVSAQFDQHSSAIGYWSMRISGGLYRQFINEYRMTGNGPSAIAPSFSIWSHADGSAVPKAWHLNGSFFAEPSRNTTITIEGYYKWQPVTNITTYRFLSESDAEPVTTIENRDKFTAFGESTDMQAMGAGMRINRTFAGSKLKVMAGYDYSFSRINMESQFGRKLPSPWNEPHRVQARAFWHLLPSLSLISKWQSSWGRTWAYRDSYYYILPQRNTGLSSPHSFLTPERDHLPAFHQFDISLVYQPQLGSASLELRLDLINVLNRKNTLDQYLAPLHQENGTIRYETRHRTLPGFYPTFSVSAAF